MKPILPALLPQLSIVIINWNGLQDLKACLSSLKKQSLSDYEIIVVDNGSTDGSAEFLKENLENLQQGSAAGQLILNKSNLGFCKAANQGIKAAQTTWVFLLNADIQLDSVCLEEILKVAQNCSEQCLGIFPKVLFLQAPIIINAFGARWHYHYQWRDNRVGLIDCGQFVKSEKVTGSIFPAVLLRKDLFFEIGGFDQAFFSYNEDFDLCYRANILGYHFLTAPRAICSHRYRSTAQREKKTFSEFYFYRNYWLVFLKNYELCNLIEEFPNLIQRYLLAGLRLAIKNKDVQRIFMFFKIIISLLLNLPSTIYKRWKIQPQRKIPDHQFWDFSPTPDYNRFHYRGIVVLSLKNLKTALGREPEWLPQRYWEFRCALFKGAFYYLGRVVYYLQKGSFSDVYNRLLPPLLLPLKRLFSTYEGRFSEYFNFDQGKKPPAIIKTTSFATATKKYKPTFKQNSIKISFLTERMKLGFGVDLVVHNSAAKLSRNARAITVYAGECENFYNSGGSKRGGIRGYNLVSLTDQLAYKGNIFTEEFRQRATEYLNATDTDLWLIHAPPFYNWQDSLKAPIIFVEHGTPFPDFFPEPQRKIIESSIKDRYSNIFNKLKPANRLVTISNFIKQQLYSPAKEKATVIYNGCDHYARVNSQEAKNFRNELGLSEQDLILLMVCRIDLSNQLQPYKGLLELIEIYSKIKQKNPLLKLVIVGRSNPSDAKVLHKKGIIPLVNVSPQNMGKIYAASDIYVSTSKWEGFNLPVTEAQFQGKPCIAYDIGAHSEIIINQEGGFLVKNDREFIEALETLSEDALLRKKMGKAAQAQAKKFSWEKNRASLELLIKER